MATPSLASWAGEPLSILLAALLLDALFPPMTALTRLVPNPVSATTAFARWLRRRLDRPYRSAGTRLVRGVLATAVIVGLAAALGWGVETLSARTPYAVPLEVLLLVLVLGQRRTFAEVRAGAEALARGPAGLVGARVRAAWLLAPGWDATELDAYGVARILVEAAAVSFAERVVAPVFWFLLLGLPGALGAVAANAIAERGPRAGRFSRPAVRLDDALQFLPMRLAAFMLALASLFVPRAHPIAAVEAMTSDAAKHPTLNRGWPIAAMAGALGLRLAGPQRRAGGGASEGAWIGDGRPQAEWRDVERALYLFVLASVINAALIAFLEILEQTI
ncbi:MAG TPA: cobalamin biosynthesis protein [Alphaproteobacteria bacterium]|nr:cobalamin biosynthesis protein [Alphaproteobacteria bacterium]